MGFVIRCPKCGFGQEIVFESIEWLCPQCGTRLSHIDDFTVNIEGLNIWMSEEQVAAISRKATDYVRRLVSIYCQGKMGGRRKWSVSF